MPASSLKDSNMQKVVSDYFEQHFGSSPESIVRAPGRVNIIGEQTIEIRILRGENEEMALFKRSVPNLKWDFPKSMEYSYPELSFDLGTPFKKVPNWKNPEQDTWMKNQLEKQGMDTPRRFMPKRK